MKEWILSDSHWGHSNIIKYSNRPFANVEEMNKALIDNWNNVVSKDDVVWHLGDFALGKRSCIPDIIKSLNGKINLISGNHDRGSVEWWLKAGIYNYYEGYVVYYVGNDMTKPILFVHDPIGGMYSPIDMPVVHGHIHDLTYTEYPEARFTNVCVEKINYTPIELNKIIRKYYEKW